MRKLAVLFVALWLALPSTASAVTPLVSPVPAAESAGSLDILRVQARYDVPKDRFYIQRTILAATWEYESFYASLGYIATTDFDDVGDGTLPDPQPAGDSGSMLAVGARGALWRSGEFSFNGDLQLHVLNEQVESNGVRYSMQSHEAILGVAAAWQRRPWRAYAGVDTVPYTNISMKAPGFEDMGRTDFIIVHAGGGVDIGPFLLDADVQFVGAEGIRVSLGYAF